jgi:hypothetical protein
MKEISHTDKLQEEMVEAIKKYLAEHGWQIAVIGPARISSRPPAKYNYTLEFNIAAIH